jgi:hypothetical protein
MTTAREIEQQILALIESSIEDTRVPDAIAAHADKRAGKPVTKTDADQLEAQLGLGVRVRICRQYGMTQISWAVSDGPNPWLDERSILLAHSDTNVRWPTGDDLRKKESAYFGARDVRNKARRELLADHRSQSQSVRTSVITRAAEALAKLREARAVLEDLVAYDQPLYVMRFDVEKLAGK